MKSLLSRLARRSLFALFVAMSLAFGVTAQTGSNDPGLCTIGVCFKNPADEAAYEKQNNCVFGSMCAGHAIKSSTQCCGQNHITGKPEAQQKYETSISDATTWWSGYQKRCPAMTQNKAPPDKLWAQCEVGKKHSPLDEWQVAIVEKNGGARDYCVDGCSTPASVVNAMYKAGYFIFKDKDNPTGNGPNGYGSGSSFFKSCANHDRCYQTCSTTSQSGCDDALLADMLAVCATIPLNHETTFINNLGFQDTENTRERCTVAANKMHTGLQAFGSTAFKMRRHQYCQCCA